MSTEGICIISRPVSPETDSYLLIEQQNVLNTYELHCDNPVTISIDTTIKYCTGWYDIATHTNHICESHVAVDSSYDSCYLCRKKTDFNPAFYNTSQISEKQAGYNAQPHTVYIAYFGNGIAKAGIMSDSRGKDRLYEQGALLYAIIASCPNATVAHNLESKLITKGLKNSVTKKQKAAIHEGVIDIDHEKSLFHTILYTLGYSDLEIICNLDMFYFGTYPRQTVEPILGRQVSGYVRGVVGRYLVLENNERHYGFWLTELFGHKITIDSEIISIDRTPQQVGLF